MRRLIAFLLTVCLFALTCFFVRRRIAAAKRHQQSFLALLSEPVASRASLRLCEHSLFGWDRTLAWETSRRACASGTVVLSIYQPA